MDVLEQHKTVRIVPVVEDLFDSSMSHRTVSQAHSDCYKPSSAAVEHTHKRCAIYRWVLSD
jgi:hypothetical protein